MRYYVTADVHGYFDQLQAALTARGFFDDPQPHKLIVCGDLYDRGGQAMQLQKFILELLEKDQVILIRGNHEDLALQLLHQWHRGSYLQPHHHSNGTVDTLLQLTGTQERELYTHTEEICRSFLRAPYIQTLIPATVDYFETKNYIFTHGAIDGTCQNWYFPKKDAYGRFMDWDACMWDDGSFFGSEIINTDKTVVIGHFGTQHLRKMYGIQDSDDPYGILYREDGKVIAIDATTALSHRVNVLVVEDEFI